MKELGALQKELKDLIQDEIIGDQILLGTKDGDAVTIKGYEQYLPVKTVDEGSTESDIDAALAPYFLLQIDHVENNGRNDPREVFWNVYICVYDNSKDNQGHKDVLLLMEKIEEYFQKHRLLLGSLYIAEDSSIESALPDVDNWPYFFGGMSFSTQIVNEGVEDENI